MAHTVGTTGATWTAWATTRTRTSSEQRLEERRHGRRAAGAAAGAATKHSTEERRRGRRGRAVVVEAAGPRAVTAVVTSAMGTVSAATTTAERSTAAAAARASSLSAALVFGRDALGRVVRGGRKLAHRRGGAVCPVLLLSLLLIGHGLGDLVVVDVLGREVLVVSGAVVCLAVRAVPATSSVSSSASASKTVTAVAVGTVVRRAPVVVLGVPFAPPAALFEAALPEFGVGEWAHVVGWRRGRGRRRRVVDAGTVVVPVEITWPSHGGCCWLLMWCVGVWLMSVVC